MTVKDLIEKLKEYPKDMDVLLVAEDDDFSYAPLEDLSVKSVTWSEGPGCQPPKGEEWPEYDCLILSEG